MIDNQIFMCPNFDEATKKKNYRKKKYLTQIWCFNYRGVSRRKLTIYDDDEDNTIDMSGLPSESSDSRDSGDNVSRKREKLILLVYIIRDLDKFAQL